MRTTLFFESMCLSDFTKAPLFPQAGEPPRPEGDIALYRHFRTHIACAGLLSGVDRRHMAESRKSFSFPFSVQQKIVFRQEFQAKLKIRDKDKFCRDVDFLGTEE